MKGEQEFNHALGRALKKAKPAWKKSIFVEETQQLRESNALRVDVLIAGHESPPVAIESSYIRRDADNDAIARLGKHYAKTGDEIKTAIAVELQESHRGIARLTTRHVLKYAVHQKTSPGSVRRFPPSGFIEGSYEDIARLAASASVPKEDVDGAASKVASLVKEAACILDGAIHDDHLQRLSKILYKRSAFSGLQTTCILWLNAILVQKALYGGLHDIPMPSRDPAECIDAWRKIHEINWRAIFEPAIRILDDLLLVAPGPVTKSLDRLHEAAGVIDAAKIGSEINIGAELFPKIADDQKVTAAFYTQPPAAEFLASMTIKKDMAEWGNPDVFRDFKIADLSCGTGTLLRFGYRQVRIYHEQEGGTARTLELLHRGAMEDGLYGTDISPIASHLTSASLAVTSRQSYGSTNIGWVGVGNHNRTGSIEYIKHNSIQDLFAEGFGTSTGGEAREQSVVVKDGEVSVALMNPPYSRTRGGQSAFDLDGLSDKETTACQDRWADLIKKEDCVKTAGMAATFLCIARKKVKAGGRIGFVLPRTAAYASVWKTTRNMIEEWFTDVEAVAISPGRALGKDALSYQTMMEEMLLVATKKDRRTEEHSKVRCVTLHEPVLRVGEAAEVAKAVMMGPDTGPITLGGGEIGVSHMFKTDKGKQWSAVGSVSDVLEMIKNGLLHGHLLDMEGVQVTTFKMTTIGDLFKMGPTHDLIGHLENKDPRGAFTFIPVTSNADAVGMYRAMWKSDGKKQRSLLAVPTHKGIEHDAEKTGPMWKKRTALFCQKNMTWSSQAMVAVITKREVMGGSAWVGLKHSDKRVMKAFALWANSIFGMVTYWANGQRSQQDARSRMQVGAIGSMECPNFALLDDAMLDKAAARFDRVAGLGPLSKRRKKGARREVSGKAGKKRRVRKALTLDPAYQSTNDNARNKINKIVAEMLSAPSYDHAELTKLWCGEPSVMKRMRGKARREAADKTYR